MIQFNYENDFLLENENALAEWIAKLIAAEGYKLEEINYIFCDDEYLHKLNLEFLKHDTLTDIISFDYSIGKIIYGDIFISIERVAENASDFSVSFLEELYRVMAHGVLHYCGYKDKSVDEEMEMRQKENYYLKQLI